MFVIQNRWNSKRRTEIKLYQNYPKNHVAQEEMEDDIKRFEAKYKDVIDTDLNIFASFKNNYN
jgi:hypothetical protein